MKVAVLAYHRVNDALEAGEWNVHPEDFKLQMNFLYSNQEQFRVVSLNETLRLLCAHDEPDARQKKTCVLLTFDDGYRDNFIYAFTTLREYGFPALIFLTTDYIGVDFKKNRYRDVPWKRDYLNGQEIGEMQKQGIDFGGHSATHPHLEELELNERMNELTSSFCTVRDLTESDDISFCYPYGEYNDVIIESVKKAGFSCAFTINEGFNFPGTDKFQIKRIMVKGYDDIFSFKAKLSGGT